MLTSRSFLTTSRSASTRGSRRLSVDELTRQLAAWDVCAAGDSRTVRLEVGDPDATATAAIDAICERLAPRVGDLSRFTAALACLGPPRVGGSRYSLIAAAGRPRWLVPRAVGAAQAAPVSIVPPPPCTRSARCSSRRGSVSARALWPVLELDEHAGLAPEIAAALGRERVDLAALLPTDPQRGSRTVLCVLEDGRPIAVAKVAPARSVELERELHVLSALEVAPLQALVVPRPLAFFSWRGFDVLVTTRVPLRGRTDRALGRSEEAALIELAGLRDRLAPACGGEGSVPVHGDFCGWNTSALRKGQPAVWDWEWAHMGEPLEDWFHWQTQRLIQFGHGSVEELVRGALAPDDRLRSFCERLGVESEAAPIGLAASLRHGLSTLGSDAQGPARMLRERALTLLEGTE